MNEAKDAKNQLVVEYMRVPDEKEDVMEYLVKYMYVKKEQYLD